MTAVALFVLVVSGAVGWWMWSWIEGLYQAAPAQKDKAAARLDAIRIAASFIVGGGGAFALYLAVRRQRTQEADLDARHAELIQRDRAQAYTEEAAEITRKHAEQVAAAVETDAAARRVTELYAIAVGQLGSDKFPVRLGGLYALERLAQDNLDQRQTVVNVLCGYLRTPYTPPAGRTRSVAWAPSARRPGGLPRSASVGLAGRPGPPAVRRVIVPTAGSIDRHLELRLEREVRLTAQRILAVHLDPGDDPADPMDTFWPDIDIDLTGATLIDLDFARFRVRNSRFTGASFVGTALFAGATFKGDARFDGAIFGADVRLDRATFRADARFDGANFLGTARFDGITFEGDARFDGAAFTKYTQFGSATFTGEARLDGTAFAGEVRFDHATFTGEAWFSKSTFTESAHFGEVTFDRDAWFTSASFIGDARFDDATFGRDGLFGEATFAGKAWFGGVTVTRDALFDGTTFSAVAWFHEASFAGNGRFNGTTFGGNARFEESIFTGNAQFGRATFSGDARFDGSTFTKDAQFDHARFASVPVMTAAFARHDDDSRPRVWPPGWTIDDEKTNAKSRDELWLRVVPVPIVL